jgi:AraC-like DNA-binding protein
MQNNINEIYTEILENIRLKIISEYGSVSAFCRKKGFSKFTLSKVFNGAQKLSLTHYIKILVSLGVLPPDSNTNFDANLTVIDYDL